MIKQMLAIKSFSELEAEHRNTWGKRAVAE